MEYPTDFTPVYDQTKEQAKELIDRLFKENAELGSELYSQAVENVRAQHRAAKVNAELKDKVAKLEEVVAEVKKVAIKHNIIELASILSRTETGEILAVVETESTCIGIDATNRTASMSTGRNIFWSEPFVRVGYNKSGPVTVTVRRRKEEG